LRKDFRHMASEELLISGIEYKVRKLMDINTALMDENEKLKQKVDYLTQELEQLTLRLQKAENRIVKLSLANTLEYNFGVEEGKEKLEKLIQEIDRCIDVLSD